MAIRTKLLIIFLTISLVPLVLSGALHRIMMLRLAGELAEDTRVSLTTDAKQNLLTIVSEFGMIVGRDRNLAELAVKCQALEVENRLATAAPESPDIYLSSDYDDPRKCPGGMAISTRHFKIVADGQPIPMEVNYKHQAYVIPPGVSREDVQDQMARLSTMTNVYSTIYLTKPEMFYWQYTALESGLHTSYPGKGGYPGNYDPRKRPWYKSAKESGKLSWDIVRDATTGRIIATVSTPVHYPDGTFAGVTALDISIDSIFDSLKLPISWADTAEVKLVAFGEPGSNQAGEPVIIAQKSYQQWGPDWERDVDMEPLDSADREGLDAIINEAKADRPGVREMKEDDRTSLWAYGAGSRNKPFPVVILPQEVISSRAEMAGRQVIDKTASGLSMTGLIVLAVAIVVIILAFRSAEKITSPISQLVEVAEMIAKGDYDISVDINTGDEIQELGDTVNKMLVELKERHCPEEEKRRE